MKLLLIYMYKFSYKPGLKVLENAEENKEGQEFKNVQVAFIHVEKEDEEKIKEVEKKLIKNLKWIANKNNANRIILHSFAHLSESKAEANITKELFDRSEERLRNSGYEVYQTPFGYFLDLNLNAPGFSLARVFKSF